MKAFGTSKPGSSRLRLLSGPSLLFLFLALGSAVCGAESDSPSEIVLGMSTVLSGNAGALGQDMQRGVLAALERANRTGELKALRLRLMALDDGYEPTRAAINTRQLIETDGALAMIGNVGTPTAVVTVPLAKEEKTLLFAPFAGGPILRNTPPDRYVINFRASYDEETQATIDALIDVAGLKPEQIAFFTQKDNSAYAMGMTFLERHGLKDPATIIHVDYERNTLAVEGAVADLLTADIPPRAVMMYGAYAACAKFIRMCRASNLNPLFLSVSFVGSSSLIEALGDTDARLIVTQVVPCPTEDGFPLVREYRADLRALDPSAIAGYGDFEGYIATRILTLALEKRSSASAV
jgi:branched-chain amino acid transport system substrate-binding protein